MQAQLPELFWEVALPLCEEEKKKRRDKSSRLIEFLLTHRQPYKKNQYEELDYKGRKNIYLYI